MLCSGCGTALPQGLKLGQQFAASLNSAARSSCHARLLSAFYGTRLGSSVSFQSKEQQLASKRSIKQAIAAARTGMGNDAQRDVEEREKKREEVRKARDERRKFEKSLAIDNPFGTNVGSNIGSKILAAKDGPRGMKFKPSDFRSDTGRKGPRVSLAEDKKLPRVRGRAYPFQASARPVKSAPKRPKAKDEPRPAPVWSTEKVLSARRAGDKQRWKEGGVGGDLTAATSANVLSSFRSLADDSSPGASGGGEGESGLLAGPGESGSGSAVAAAVGAAAPAAEIKGEAYPTAVPRPRHLQDGPWTAADVAAVSKAQSDSLQLAPKLKLAPPAEEGASKAGRKDTSNVLVGRSVEELQELAVNLGTKSYRGKQLHQFLYKNKGKDLQECNLLPQEFRDALVSSGVSVGRLPVHHVAAAADGTAKLLLRLDDSRLVETVGIPMEEGERGSHRLTACVSSQVGCPLRCTFCATGKGGFARNLRPHEIVSQVLAIEELFNHRVSNVVFMGMGEPLLNLPAVLAAHRSLNRDLSIGQRMMTISTVGVPNTLQRLAEHKLQSTLAISLHAPNQRLREQIVPSAKAYPLEALLQDCQAYFNATGRRVSFEYTLLASVNDQPEHAHELADLLHKWELQRHVNVIPYNPVADSDFRRPSRAYVTAFVETLKSRNVTATIRQTRGLDANAACGQLRNSFQKTPLTAVAV